jgi:hypothetical protein
LQKKAQTWFDLFSLLIACLSATIKPRQSNKKQGKGGNYLDRQAFEALTLHEQLSFMNKRSEMTLKEIVKEIQGMPASSLSQIFSKKGYQRQKGIYVKVESEATNNDFQELLRFKDQLISLVLREQQQETSKKLDFSFLNQFDPKKKKTITFDLPEVLADQLDSFVKASGFKKQAVYSLAIYELVQKKF